MAQDSIPDLQLGDPVPDCVLPDGSRLAEWRGRPVILEFAPVEWNPAYAYQSDIVARLSQVFGDQAAFIDTATDDWHSLDSRSEIARQLGVVGQRALWLLDERGVLRWKLVVDNDQAIRPGDVLTALESLNPSADASATPVGGLSRRTFLTALLAAAAVLVLFQQRAEAATDSPPVAADSDAGYAPVVGQEVPVTLSINGKAYHLSLEPRVALLNALRENLHLTGTKKGCDHGQCGACTVHISGQSALSCLTLAVMSQGKAITTIEGLALGDPGAPEMRPSDWLHPVQMAFIKHDAFQCGYCTPGQIMAATALLQDKTLRSAVEIREAMSGNLCRCAAYPNIIAAIQEAQTA